jgi:hypothetical protein
MIVAISVVVAAIVYFMLRKKTTANTVVTSTLQAVPAAPGVNATTGQVPSYTPTGSSAIQKVVGLAQSLAPSSIVQHVPVIGGLASAAAKAPIALTEAGLNEASNVLSQVTILGKVAAAPVKAVNNIIHSISSFF